MEPVSKSGLEHRNALMSRPHSLWCDCPEGFGSELAEEARKEWLLEYCDIRTESGNGGCVADMAHRSRNRPCVLRGAVC